MSSQYNIWNRIIKIGDEEFLITGVKIGNKEGYDISVNVDVMKLSCIDEPIDVRFTIHKNGEIENEPSIKDIEDSSVLKT